MGVVVFVIGGLVNIKSKKKKKTGEEFKLFNEHMYTWLLINWIFCDFTTIEKKMWH